MSHRATPATPAAAPHVGRRIRFLLLTVASLLAALAVSTWRPAAQKATATPVRTLAAAEHVAANPGEKGTTYYSLEAQTIRFITKFADGTNAVAERNIDGDVSATLEDGQGNQLNRFNVHRNDGINDVLQYVRPGEAPLLARADPTVRVTLDWVNGQTHRLYQDGVRHDTQLEWKGKMMRPVGAAPADGDPDHDVIQVETQWANGLSARTTRVRPKPGDQFDGNLVNGDVLVTKVMRGGVEVGLANYFTHERIYAWKMPGVTEGLVANEHLKARHGGWPFTPDMVWMNLQALALHHWKITIDQKGFVAQNDACRPAPGAAQRLLQFLEPVVHADEPGCDGLHWLDGTVLRYCCDIHDRCYEKYGCSSASWWQFWSSWSCDYCNMGAVWCFVDGGTGHGPFYPYP